MLTGLYLFLSVRVFFKQGKLLLFLNIRLNSTILQELIIVAVGKCSKYICKFFSQFSKEISLRRMSLLGFNLLIYFVIMTLVNLLFIIISYYQLLLYQTKLFDLLQ